MESNITKEQIELFKKIINMAEPYPIEILCTIKYDDNELDLDRLDATIAKKILMESGIDVD